MTLEGARIYVRGIVQGVGFRPFVYGLAKRLELSGWVRNTSAGVEIEVDGPRLALEAFLQALDAEAPALAHVDQVEIDWRAPNGFAEFEILHSEGEPAEFQPISPDVSICADCLRELLDPHDRRYRYPFINCTNCGPRFTIIRDIPYDRPKTSMASFTMCADCAAEYENPLDRRFHAQPVACPRCGPQVWLEEAAGDKSGVSLPATAADREPLLRAADRRSAQGAGQVVGGERAILEARRLLRAGKILAIKGLGGFHLACDATNPQAVDELRRRKLRVDKPFALMMADIEMVAVYCQVSPVERGLVERRERPIVIVRRRPDSPAAAQVAPGQNTIGVMLPYTPLHYLLFADPDRSSPAVFDMPALVMTSGNLSEEPICTENDEARQRLVLLADAFLMHDRPIHIRCDDSVVRMFPATRGELQKKAPSALYPIRRARGYAPGPVRLGFDAPSLLATGAELKNTFCLTRGGYAFLSHHIGDMENAETVAAFEQGIEHFERLFRIQPGSIAYDLHPDYLATRYALERAEREGLPAFGVQHHHAHIAACMAENGLRGAQRGEPPVIGVAFDGTGYGEDGAVWGGEFLIADYASYQRAAHLAYIPLAGGDQAVRQPWRTALAWLWAAGISWDEDLPPVQHAQKRTEALNLADQPLPQLEALRRQIETGLNAPPTSSMGRLFDAVAALIGVRQTVNYEAQAAIEMEAQVDGREPAYYPFERQHEIINPAPMFQQIVADLRSGASIPTIAARFHSGVAMMVLETCADLSRDFDTKRVALSGGVWQNAFLLTLTVGLLQEKGYEVYIHRQTPANDGGLALGQAVVAISRL